MSSSSSSSIAHTQQGVSLPNALVQNHIHEIAIKSMTPPRKQNTACDACRARKVKCNRLQGQDKCQHCITKNYPCTHFIQQATNEKKRSTHTSRRPRPVHATPSDGSPASAPSRLTPPSPATATTPGGGGHVERSQNEYVTSPLSSYPPQMPSAGPSYHHSPQLNTISSAYHHQPVSAPMPVYSGPTFQQALGTPPITRSTATTQLLLYLLSPPEDDAKGSSSPMMHGQRSYAEWGDAALQLDSAAYRAEFALDLVEVYFQIVHTRWPLLNPNEFRLRLRLAHHSMPPSPASSAGSPVPYLNSSSNLPLHPAIVATVLAWGAKFSEHPILVGDRSLNGGQGHLAKTLIDRAREVAETLKVHRIASTDHVLVGLLLEPLQTQNPEDPSGFHAFWLAAAIRHLFALQINHKSVMGNIPDPETRATMIFAWWMALIADAYGSAYYRRKPMIDDGDYDIDFYAADPAAAGSGSESGSEPSGVNASSAREQLEFLGYFRAAHALARISRQISRQLWRPAAQSDGLSLDVVRQIIALLCEWRDRFLPQVGVPSNFAAEWDFISAISACASDATYHIMWIILFNALDDFGVREANEMISTGNSPNLLPHNNEIENTKSQVMKETLHGALRIAGLAGVLASNGYLRLDPAVMHVSCIQAGTFLAKLGRPEVSNCIAALKQYSYAYEEAGEQGQDIERIFNRARAGEVDLAHMASVVPGLRGMNGGSRLMDTS